MTNETMTKLAELYLNGTNILDTLSEAYQFGLNGWVAMNCSELYANLGKVWSVNNAHAARDFQALQDMWDHTDHIYITDEYNDSKLFPGWFNLAFRAWHDATHALFGNEFTPSGEADTAWVQCWATEDRLTRKIIFSEVVLQVCAYEYLGGKFPEGEQRVVLVSDEVIDRFMQVGSGILDEVIEEVA